MNPRPTSPESAEHQAKVRDMVVRKLEAKGVDTATDDSVAASLQRALAENA